MILRSNEVARIIRAPDGVYERQAGTTAFRATPSGISPPPIAEDHTRLRDGESVFVHWDVVHVPFHELQVSGDKRRQDSVVSCLVTIGVRNGATLHAATQAAGGVFRLPYPEIRQYLQDLLSTVNDAFELPNAEVGRNSARQRLLDDTAFGDLFSGLHIDNVAFFRVCTREDHAQTIARWQDYYELILDLLRRPRSAGGEEMRSQCDRDAERILGEMHRAHLLDLEETRRVAATQGLDLLKFLFAPPSLAPSDEEPAPEFCEFCNMAMALDRKPARCVTCGKRLHSWHMANKYRCVDCQFSTRGRLKLGVLAIVAGVLLLVVGMAARWVTPSSLPLQDQNYAIFDDGWSNEWIPQYFMVGDKSFPPADYEKVLQFRIVSADAQTADNRSIKLDFRADLSPQKWAGVAWTRCRQAELLQGTDKSLNVMGPRFLEKALPRFELEKVPQSWSVSSGAQTVDDRSVKLEFRTDFSPQGWVGVAWTRCTPEELLQGMDRSVNLTGGKTIEFDAWTDFDAFPLAVEVKACVTGRDETIHGDSASEAIHPAKPLLSLTTERRHFSFPVGAADVSRVVTPFYVCLAQGNQSDQLPDAPVAVYVDSIRWTFPDGQPMPWYGRLAVPFIAAGIVLVLTSIVLWLWGVFGASLRTRRVRPAMGVGHGLLLVWLLAGLAGSACSREAVPGLQSRTVYIDSVPPGASVYAVNDGEPQLETALGVTPLKLDISQCGAKTFWISMTVDAYAAAVKDLPAAEKWSSEMALPSCISVHDAFRFGTDTLFCTEKQDLALLDFQPLLAFGPVYEVGWPALNRVCALFIPNDLKTSDFQPLMPPPGTFAEVPSHLRRRMSEEFLFDEEQMREAFDCLSRCGKYVGRVQRNAAGEAVEYSITMQGPECPQICLEQRALRE